MSARTLAAVALTALASTGCMGTLKERWDYEPVLAKPLSDGTPPPVVAKDSCRVPLRVAVKPFHSDRAGGNYGVGGVTGWILAGLIISPPTSLVAEWTEKDMRQQLVMYKHSEARTWAYALYDEIAHTGCFEAVAYDPLDESQYDLVLSADVLRHGKMMRFPFVPLPIYVGTITSLIASSYDRMIEMDVHADSWAGKPVLDYGFQASCSGTMGCVKELNATAEISSILHDGYGEFMSRLADYLASRSGSYWQMIRERRVDQQRARLDPDLPALDAAIRTADGDARAALQAERDRRAARLDAMLDEDRRLEDQWTELSLAVFRRDVDQVNDQIDDIFTQRMIAASLAAAGTVAGAAGAMAKGAPAPDALQVQADVQNRMNAALADEQRVLGLLESLKKALGLNLGSGDPLAGKVDRFAAALKARAVQRAAALADYEAARKPPAQILQSQSPPPPAAKPRRKGT
jgi:hypothetical protein